MTGLSFAAALVGAKPSTAEKVVATADVAATPTTRTSSENAVPSTLPTAPTVRKNAWPVAATATPTAEKSADAKVTRAACETTAISKPAATKPEATNDEPSVSSASQPVEVATATATARSIAKRREAQETQNQNKINGGKKCAWKKLDADVPSRAENHSSKDKGRSPTQEQQQQNENQSENNAGKHKKKKGDANRSSHDGKQKKYTGNKPKQQKGSSQATNQQHKGNKVKLNNALKGGEKIGNQNSNKSKKKSAKSNNNSKKKNNKGQKQRKNVYPQPPPLSPAELEQLKVAVLYQVEFFFSDDELCRNTFLRRNMDCEGYVPAAMIFNFPSIAAYCFKYYDLLTVLAEKSNVLEIDRFNETLRRRDDYQKWLCPNSEGGFGCPRWIKQVQDGTQKEANAETTTTKSNEIASDAGEADDASSGGSNVTPDTDSCTDSENLEQLEQGEAEATIVLA